MTNKKNGLKNQILDLIYSSNGIRIKDLQKTLNRHKNSILYHINILKNNEHKIIGPIEKKYYSPDHPEVKKYAFDYSVVNGFNSEFLLTMRSFKILFEKIKKKPFYKASQEEKEEFLNENQEKFSQLYNFEAFLLDSIQIGIKPQSAFISDTTLTVFLKDIHNFLYDLFLSVGFWDNFTDFSKIPFEINISVGYNLKDKLKDIDFENIKQFQVSEYNNNVYNLIKKRAINQIIKRKEILDLLTEQYLQLESPIFKLEYNECLKDYEFYYKFESKKVLKKNLNKLTETFIREKKLLMKETDFLEKLNISKRSNKYRKNLIQYFIVKNKKKKDKKL